MYTNSAYLNNSLLDIKDKSKLLIVTSCGTYHLFTHKKLPTWRPKGRLDFQLLYIASGKAHFHFGDKEEIITAGHMVFIGLKNLKNMNILQSPLCFFFQHQIHYHIFYHNPFILKRSHLYYTLLYQSLFSLMKLHVERRFRNHA